MFNISQIDVIGRIIELNVCSVFEVFYTEIVQFGFAVSGLDHIVPDTINASI